MRFLAPLLLLATTSAFALSQEQQPPQTPRTGKTPESVDKGDKPDNKVDNRAGDKAHAGKADGILAGWLLVDNNNEVALAQLAVQRAQDNEVKQFAQKMIDDHRAMGAKLQPFASLSGLAATPPGQTPGRENMDDPDSKTRDGRPTPAGFGGSELDHAALIQELGQQCLATARKDLEAKSGAEFDRCYMGMMIGAHNKANDMLTVFQRHSTSELKTVLGEGQKTVATHLQHAKDIAKRLDGSREAAKAPAGSK